MEWFSLFKGLYCVTHKRKAVWSSSLLGSSAAFPTQALQMIMYSLLAHIIISFLKKNFLKWRCQHEIDKHRKLNEVSAVKHYIQWFCPIIEYVSNKISKWLHPVLLAVPTASQFRAVEQPAVWDQHQCRGHWLTLSKCVRYIWIWVTLTQPIMWTKINLQQQMCKHWGYSRVSSCRWTSPDVHFSQLFYASNVPFYFILLRISTAAPLHDMFYTIKCIKCYLVYLCCQCQYWQATWIHLSANIPSRRVSWDDVRPICVYLYSSSR